jgi:hypothetical protein
MAARTPTAGEHGPAVHRLTRWKMVFAGWQLGTRPIGDDAGVEALMAEPTVLRAYLVPHQGRTPAFLPDEAAVAIDQPPGPGARSPRRPCPMPGNQIVNDEATIAVTVRCAGRATRGRLARALAPVLPAIEQAIRPLVDGDDAFISGIHIDLPDFQPSRYQPAPATDRAALAELVGNALAALPPAPALGQQRWTLEQVARHLGLDVADHEPGVAP